MKFSRVITKAPIKIQNTPVKFEMIDFDILVSNDFLKLCCQTQLFCNNQSTTPDFNDFRQGHKQKSSNAWSIQIYLDMMESIEIAMLV